ncbi:snRNA-activating protein complex subunit 5 isoform X2 [Falco biarmicus]|uniref:snRNA-activating protein complex subunit 5 isoform X2 n=1 Tax=Falco rusticolus TaxID=120794 RepID=UPI0018867B49|nr:snRNA-activating protein complex subunit 5 isoform X2 [Falco rusticolus]XP_040457431.1 snRNA-activating protein complex subunit 5 isoform X2 [Falco naumanni]XP_055573341.1 snRNA-activating protein complex subunit 5 isoform X2 [Falco cherrug]XP_055671799.1 snRNA-activating protein complex subunit 5 isoform X2 [Falco peregrinus]XP_056203691.1 snRNA-activating protein complex subunit 5 isoform X2 [Falco biarmicus]
MLSRLQELRKEEETLLRVKAALRDQLTRLKVEELALQSMMRSGEESVAASSSAAEETQTTLGQMDNEAAINQTELHLSLKHHEEEEEEEEEESDS